MIWNSFFNKNRPAFMPEEKFWQRFNAINSYLTYRIVGGASLNEKLVYILEVGLETLEDNARSYEEGKKYESANYSITDSRR